MGCFIDKLYFFIISFFIHKNERGKSQKSGSLSVFRIFIPYCTSILHLVLSQFSFYSMPSLTGVFVSIQYIVIAIAICKYELFTISAVRAVPKIIQTMSDSLILINPDRTIAVVNHTLLPLLQYKEQELISKKVDDIIPDHPKNCW